MKARKFIEKHMEGEYEIAKSHIISIDIDEHVLDTVADFIGATGDDPEWEYTDLGIVTNQDGDFVAIEIGRFLEAVDKANQEKQNVGDDELDEDTMKSLEVMRQHKE